MKGFWMDDDIEDLELSNGKLEMKALQKLCRPACFVLEEFRTGLVVSKSGQRPLSGPPQNLQEGCRRELLRFLSCLRIASWSSSAIGCPEATSAQHGGCLFTPALISLPVQHQCKKSCCTAAALKSLQAHCREILKLQG